MSSFFDNHLGIQICKDRIRLVEVVYKEDDLYLENVDERKFEKKIESFSDLAGILQNVYDGIRAQKQFNSKLVSYTFPPSLFKVFEVPFDPVLLKGDLKEHLNWELRKLYPYDSDTEYLIQSIQYQGDSVSRGSYVGVIALPKPFISEIVKFSKTNHLSVKFIDHPQNAANVFLPQIVQDFKIKNGVSLYVGAEALTIMVLASGLPVFIKQFNFGSMEELENRLKKVHDNFTDYEFDLENMNYVSVSGESVTEELINNLVGLFGKEIKIVNPFEKIKFSPGAEPVYELGQIATEFAAPTGLALRLM